MGGYSAMLEKALEQYNPSVVARYCFDLAQAFNDFYAKCPILTDDDLTTSAARLALSQAVKNVLINGLSLLSITPVEEM